jgi:predicted secreted protein
MRAPTLQRATRAATLALALGCATSLAQVGAPSDALGWSWQAQRVTAAPAGAQREYQLTFVASVAAGYVVYGSDYDAKLGPRPTRVRFAEATPVEAVGPLESVNTKRKYDKAFNAGYSYFSQRVELRQKIRVDADATHVSGRVLGQTCFEADGTCSLFSQPFDIELK